MLETLEGYESKKDDLFSLVHACDTNQVQIQATFTRRGEHKRKGHKISAWVEVIIHEGRQFTLCLPVYVLVFVLAMLTRGKGQMQA